MTWNKGLPANGTKIRDYPTVLTNNFASIEEGDDQLQHWKSNFIERDSILPVPPPSDPVAIADVMQIYSKENTDQPDLYIADDTGAYMQLTDHGKIGGPAQDFALKDLYIETDTVPYTANNFVAYWATIDAAGAIQGQSGGLTAARNSLGIYTVSFTVPQASVNYGVLTNPEHALGNATITSYSLKTVNDFVVRIINQSGTKVDLPFTVSIFGGR